MLGELPARGSAVKAAGDSFVSWKVLLELIFFDT